MKIRYDILEQLKSSREIEALICDVRAAVHNDYFRQKYEEAVTAILQRSAESIDTVPAVFLYRLVQLLDAVFPCAKSYRERSLSSLQVIAQTNHLPRLTQISKMSRKIVECYQPAQDKGFFSLASLLRVYKKAYLNGLDLMKANSALAMQAEEFSDTLRNGALIGQFLFGQCQYSINFALCRLMVRKTLLRCVRDGCANFLNGFSYYVLNEIVQIYKFQKQTARQYLQVVFDEYFNIMEQCVGVVVTPRVVQAICDIFLLSNDQVIQKTVHSICQVEMGTILRFVVRFADSMMRYQLALVFELAHSFLLAKQDLPLLLLSWLPCAEVSQVLFPLIFAYFAESHYHTRQSIYLDEEQVGRRFYQWFLAGEQTLCELSDERMQAAFRAYIDERVARYHLAPKETVFGQDTMDWLSNELTAENASERIDNVTPYQLIYIVYFLISRDYNYWYAAKLSQNELFQSALLYFQEHFRNK